MTKKFPTTLAYAIFLQALVAMLGSLYYSTFGDPVKNLLTHHIFPIDSGFLPCELCWFQRILMYPIVILSIVGLLKEDRRFTDYILPLSILGMGLSSYHYALQKLHLATHFGCTLSNPCNALQVQYLGFITIPFLAFIAFTVITILGVMNVLRNRKTE